MHKRLLCMCVEERSCGTDARGQRDRQRQRGLHEAGAWSASKKRIFSELQHTGLWLARGEYEGGPALRARLCSLYQLHMGPGKSLIAWRLCLFAQSPLPHSRSLSMLLPALPLGLGHASMLLPAFPLVLGHGPPVRRFGPLATRSPIRQ